MRAEEEGLRENGLPSTMASLKAFLGRWSQPPVSRRPDAAHAAVVERTLATVRVVIAAMSLVGTWLDPSEAGLYSNLTIVLLASYAAYASLVLVTVRESPARGPRRTALLHAVDFAWFTVLTSATGGVSSPLHTLFFFSLLAAGYKWGRNATMATALAAGGVVLAQAGAGLLGLSAHPFHLNIVIVRVAGFVLIGLLVGLIAENEHNLRGAASAVAGIMSLVRMDSGLVASVEAVLFDLLSRFDARRAVLILAEDDEQRTVLWEAEAKAPGEKRRVRPMYIESSDDQALTFPIPAGASAWYAERPSPAAADGKTVIAAVNASGHSVPVRPPVESLLAAAFPWATVHCLSSISGDGWSGRLFIFDSRAGGSRVDQLRFLQTVLNHVGPALFNLYLQRRMRSRSGAVERARAARELHDGIIQSMVGMDMLLEATRRGGEGSLPATTLTELSNIQDILRTELLNLRDLMQLLRPVDVNPSKLVEHLADQVNQFRRVSGIQARFVCDADDITLPARVAREMAGAVHEALVNARKHSRAKNVLVRVTHDDDAWHVVIEDDGRGFDFEGRFTQEELDRDRRGPVILKEHVRAMGGTLSLHSQPGVGARLEISVPGPRFN